MKIKWKKKDITSAVTSVTWSGSAEQAARTLSFSVVYSPYDNGKTFQIEVGDEIKFWPGWPEDQKTYFFGNVTQRERKSEAGELMYTATDRMQYLLRSSGTYKFIKQTPEAIAQKICALEKITPGSLAKTNIRIPKLYFNNKPLYEVIMAAYSEARKKQGTKKKKYMAVMDGKKLSVIQKGTTIRGLMLKEGKSIISSTFNINSDNIVNQVAIYKDNKQIGVYKDTKSIKRYGLFQTRVDVKEGDGQAEAQAEAAGLEKSASLEALGNTKCISGYAIKIRDGKTGLVGKYWIESDSHTWEGGNYTMSLELAFKNVMKIYESDQEKKTKTNTKTRKTDTSSTTTANTDTDTEDEYDIPQVSNALQDVLNQARAWIGIGENPNNTNAVTAYYGWNGVAWCCIYVWACFNKSGHGNLFMGGGKTAYCFDVMNWYKARGKFGSVPRVGALVIYGGQGHIGIIETTNGSSYISIEGNVSNTCARRSGPNGNVLGYCYVDY